MVGLCFRLRAAEVALDARSVLAAALLVLALGVCMPQQIALWVGTLAWSKVARLQDSGDPALPASTSDRSLHWVVVAMLALMSGVAMLLLPIISAWGVGARAWLDEAFLWPAPTNLMLDATIALCICLATMFPLGVMLCALHHLSCPLGQWNAQALVWFLGGAGVLLVTTLAANLEAASPNLLLVGGALPILSLPLMIVGVGRTDSGPTPPTAVAPIAAPTERDRWPRLLRSSIVAVGGGGACVAYVWSERLGAAAFSTLWVVAVAPLALAAGMWVATMWEQAALRSVAGFGMGAAMAGVVTAMTTAFSSPTSLSTTTQAVAPAIVAIFAIGLAVGHGRALLWARVANRAAAGAAELTRFLLCIAGTVAITAPLVVRLFGHRATLQMVALSLVALGGTLVIHDPGHAPQVRHRRLAAVFASLGGMILVALFTKSASGQ